MFALVKITSKVVQHILKGTKMWIFKYEMIGLWLFVPEVLPVKTVIGTFF